MSGTTGTCPGLVLAREAIDLACRTAGNRKRGWAWVAELLGVPERRVESIAYGEPATIDTIAAARARLTLAEQRLAQLDAERSHLREIIDAARNPVDVAR